MSSLPENIVNGTNLISAQVRVFTSSIDLSKSESESALKFSCTLDIEAYFDTCFVNTDYKLCRFHAIFEHQTGAPHGSERRLEFNWPHTADFQVAIYDFGLDFEVNLTEDCYRRKEFILWKEKPTVYDTGNFSGYFCSYWPKKLCHQVAEHIRVFGMLHSLPAFFSL